MNNKNCDYCNSCNYCFSCDYCNSCDYCDYCDYCDSCENLVNGFMCINLKLEKKDPSKYWIFNKEVSKKEWDNRFKIGNKKNEKDKLIHIQELKEEAIKWVKEDKEWYWAIIGDILKGKQVNSITMDLLRRWMRRLNITEEDLK